ncbi:unnamed protein product [Linum tenue]|uniref:F-box domain-containing protein n=1 Tax=Linum tenue TaxID=586396 RepID=A0AAV0INC9_9ROSI|nr:unnamed protein product [Linum tenue]
MAIENCISDWDRPLNDLRRRAVKRPRISSKADLPPMTMKKLGLDLLEDILIRLPNPRSACRCKLVCKQWVSLISSPRFNRRFVSHHQSMNHHPPIPDDPSELQSIILSFLPPMPCTVRDDFRVLDCNKDLVLCGSWDADLSICDSESARSYLVCNPFTKEWIALPLAPRKDVYYYAPMPRLVCEPRMSTNLDLGDGETFVYSEYRFRVVCMYQVAEPNTATKLDVFCSESGQWTKEALVCDDQLRITSRSLVSCNGELFWQYIKGKNEFPMFVAVYNPFRPDIPPKPIDISAFLVKPRWYISGSQGALHIIAIENETVPVHLTIWRLEEDQKSWRKQCEGLVNKSSKCGNYEVLACLKPFLHPDQPEIVFFNRVFIGYNKAMLRCDLRSEEVEFFAKLRGWYDICHFQVFQPRVPCWPTPIPRYEKLQGMHDGSYNFWVQSSSEAKLQSLPPSLNICKQKELKRAPLCEYSAELPYPPGKVL